MRKLLPKEAGVLERSFGVSVFILISVSIFSVRSAPAPKVKSKPAASALKPLSLDKINFEAEANLRAMSIHGEVKKIDGSIAFDKGKIALLDIRIPVEELTTHMSMRDEHMRNRIFKTEAGTLPPVHLVVKDVQCKSLSADKWECPLKGDLEIRGTPKPFESKMQIAKDGSKEKGSGEGLVKLSTYNIPQPEQLGVKVADQVKITYEVSF